MVLVNFKSCEKCKVPYWDEINKSYLTPIVAQLSGEDNPSAGYISRALFSLVVFGLVQKHFEYKFEYSIQCK